MEGDFRRRQPQGATIFSRWWHGDDDNDANDNSGGGLGSGAIWGTNNSDKGGGAYNSNTNSKHNGSMLWCRYDNYNVTRDTEHEYQLGINEQHKHLAKLTRFFSCDEYFCGYNPHSQNYQCIDDQM